MTIEISNKFTIQFLTQGRCSRDTCSQMTCLQKDKSADLRKQLEFLTLPSELR